MFPIPYRSAEQSSVSKMISVIFVCLGNICRSPMAEAVFKRLAHEEGVDSSLSVSSFATSDYEVGNPVYPPAQRVLDEKGYTFSHRAQKLTLAEIKNADYVLVMDGMNYEDVCRTAGKNYENKVFKLGSFLPEPIDIADPWYTGDFERAYSEIYSSCKVFLHYLMTKHERAFEYDSRH